MGENKECHLHQETFPDSPGWASQCLAPNSFGQITEGYKRQRKGEAPLKKKTDPAIDLISGASSLTPLEEGPGAQPGDGREMAMVASLSTLCTGVVS